VTNNILRPALLSAWLAVGCGGSSVPAAPPEQPSPAGPECGGIAGRRCPDGKTCVDDPTDACSPEAHGLDCGGICVDASSAPPASGETAPPSPEGCGAAAAGQRYIGRSADECARIRFACEAGEEYFSNDCGCGCQKTGAPSQ
jgi:hypothetical protein